MDQHHIDVTIFAQLERLARADGDHLDVGLILPLKFRQDRIQQPGVGGRGCGREAQRLSRRRLGRHLLHRFRRLCLGRYACLRLGSWSCLCLWRFGCGAWLSRVTAGEYHQQQHTCHDPTPHDVILRMHSRQAFGYLYHNAPSPKTLHVELLVKALLDQLG